MNKKKHNRWNILSEQSNGRLERDRRALYKLHPRLTRSEQEVVIFIREGYTSSQIAEILYVSEKSIENYRNRIHHHLNLEPGVLLKPILISLPLNENNLN
jgi:DNA-binding CsgD family transcriptional regulator